MFLAAVVLGCRLVKGRMPLAADCSAAISASCHPPDSEKNVELKPIRWGEVSVAGREGEYCTFSSGDVAEPNPERFYS